jgi:hypothetical protein
MRTTTAITTIGIDWQAVERRLQQAKNNQASATGRWRAKLNLKEEIGEMRDEEMATDRWENEGGRTSTK